MLNISKTKKIIVLIVVLLAILIAFPNLLSEELRKKIPNFLPNDAVNLGLDLQGGSYLLLEVDFDKYLSEQTQSDLDYIRSKLTQKRLAYKYKTSKNNIKFKAAPKVTKNQLKEELEELLYNYSIEMDEENNVELKLYEKYIFELRREIVAKSIEVIRRRIDQTGTKEPIIQPQGLNRILLQVPGFKDPEKLEKLIGKTAKLSFHLVNPEDQNRYSKAPDYIPDGFMIAEHLDSTKENPLFYMVTKKAFLTGEHVKTAGVAKDSNGKNATSIAFTSKGADLSYEYTSKNINQLQAIILDNRIISIASINDAISRNAIISGSMSLQDVIDLSILLRAGSLPAEIDIIQKNSVGASLGADSIEAGKIASIIAIIAVIIVMIIFYKRFGIYSNISLIVNLIIIIAALSMFGATLTLPGIAGLVLTIGMAVDANVLIFERIKEELKKGKTPFAAVDKGFSQAYGTIIDSNITTLVATILLFLFGSGPVKGFAVTLSIGILASMFSAILLTRILVVTWLKKTKPKELKI